MKLLKLNFKQIIIIFSTLFLGACNKNEDNTAKIQLGSQEKFTITDFENLRKLQWKGLFTVANSQIVTQSYEKGEDWHRGSTIVGVQAIKDVSKMPPATVNDISVQIPDIRDGKSPNQIRLNSNDEGGNSLFGQNVNINAFGITGSIYIPERFKLLSPVPDNVSVNSYKGTPIKRAEGVNLKWNADSKNNRGVILEVNYYYPNGQGYDKTVRLLDDNGSYVVGSDLLTKIPKDGYFEITLLRGNYHIGENKEDLIMCMADVTSGYKLLD
jgi:hypothetical protein